MTGCPPIGSDREIVDAYLDHFLAGSDDRDDFTPFFEADELLEMASDPQVKETLKTWTQEAVERGVFGAPTFFVGGEMFWGQDRLDFVRSALKND